MPKTSHKELQSEPTARLPKALASNQRTVGLALLFTGSFFLLNTLTGYQLIRLWPVILIILGVAALLKRSPQS